MPCLSISIPEEEDEEEEEQTAAAALLDPVPHSGLEAPTSAGGVSETSDTVTSFTVISMVSQHMDMHMSRLYQKRRSSASSEEGEEQKAGQQMGRKRHHTFSGVDLQRPIISREKPKLERQHSTEHPPFHRQDSKGKPDRSIDGHRLTRQESLERAVFAGTSRSPRLLENWSPSFLGIGADGRIRSFSFTSSRPTRPATPKKKPQHGYKSVEMFRG